VLRPSRLADAKRPQRRRRRVRRYSRNNRATGDWVPQYAPIICEAMQTRGVLPTHWPEAITVDSFDVRVSALRPNGRPLQGGHSIYHVFVAVGYEGDEPGRLWRVGVYPKNDEEQWAEFFGELHGEPKIVVADRDLGIRNGVDRAFLNTEIYPCTYHLMLTLRERLWRAQMNSIHERIWRLTRSDLFVDPWSWVLFRQELNHLLSGERTDLAFRQLDGLLAIQRWCERNEPEIQRVLFRPHRPVSNGLAEEHLRVLRNKLGDRRRNFRNLERLSWLLKLMMLHQLGEADEDDWALILKENHIAYHGKPPPRRSCDGKVIALPRSGAGARASVTTA
jgi:hypothetical protein